MSNYRRLISYIYEYEGKTKGRNVGFAKLEARSGQCKDQRECKTDFYKWRCRSLSAFPYRRNFAGKIVPERRKPENSGQRYRWKT